jgi:hypothetical protein
VVALGNALSVNLAPARVEEVSDPQQAIASLRKSDTSFAATATGAPGHHTVFAKVRQGEIAWWVPIDFETRPALEIVASAEQRPGDVRFRLRNNTDRAISAPVAGVTSATPVAARSESAEVSLPASGMLPGANRVRAAAVEALVTNWSIRAQNVAWDEVDLSGAFNDRVTQIFQNRYVSPRSPYASLSIPVQGIGGWADNKTTAEIDDSGLRAAARAHGGIFSIPDGIPFRTPGDADAKNIVFTSQWDNYPREKAVPLSGKARHVYLLMAGSTNFMQSRMDNAEVVVAYADGTSERLALENPSTWWPIEQDYMIDDYQFQRPGPLPPRVDLKTATARFPEIGKDRKIPGGSATVLDMPLDPAKELKSLTVRTIANEVVVGLMSVTLAR